MTTTENTQTRTTNPLIEAVIANVKNVEEQAAKLIADSYKAHGRCTLSCDCGAWEAFIDADALGNYADTRKVRDLIEHVRFDHVTPHDLIATVVHVALTF